MPFSEYSTFYDLYYADKDYAVEVDFVLELASRFGVKPQNLLDMGCGTGRHLEEFVERGLKCDGFDLSSEMLSQARSRLPGTGVGLSEGNIIDFKNGKQYDLVVAMFAVMGYFPDNEQLLAGLCTAQSNCARKACSSFTAGSGLQFWHKNPRKDPTNTRMVRIRS